MLRIRLAGDHDPGQQHGERRALPCGALHVDVPAVLLDDAQADPQSQARPPRGKSFTSLKVPNP